MSSGDYSRVTFDPTKNYHGVLIQQGRVQLDADWNEMVAIVDRRLRALAADTLGPCVVPTAQSFEIQRVLGPDVKSRHYTIGCGRIYVDGLVAENDGSRHGEIHPLQGEVNSVPYHSQPYYLAEAQVLPDGPFLFYVDVWQREITCLQDPDLTEVALGEGLDTTTRLQTIWQVKHCALTQARTIKNYEKDPAWTTLIAPSTARLSAVGTYRGEENRLYRVEIHKGGKAGKATIKWSRDNGSIAAKVESINGKILTVQRLDRDELRRFSANQWVELTDDIKELTETPGLLARIKKVNEETRTIELDVPDEEMKEMNRFTVDDSAPIPRYTRIRRWDNRGEIPIPDDGSPVTLEHGVEVEFHISSKEEFRTGQHWSFTVRADGSLDKRAKALPCEPRHHYGCLALLNETGYPTNCRSFWPPPPATIEGFDYTVKVTHGDFSKNHNCIQDAIDKVAKAGGGTVRLGPGRYVLRSPLIFYDIGSVCLKGAGRNTILASDIPTKDALDNYKIEKTKGDDERTAATKSGKSREEVDKEFPELPRPLPLPANIMMGGECAGATITDLNFDVSFSGPADGAIACIIVLGGKRVTVENCEFSFSLETPKEDVKNPSVSRKTLGVGIAGKPSNLIVRRNSISALTGIAALSETEIGLFLERLRRFGERYQPSTPPIPGIHDILVEGTASAAGHPPSTARKR